MVSTTTRTVIPDGGRDIAKSLVDSDQTSYALNSIGAARWPAYGDWKPNIKKYFIFGVNYADVPIESLAKYCAADSLISRKVLRAALKLATTWGVMSKGYDMPTAMVLTDWINSGFQGEPPVTLAPMSVEPVEGKDHV